MSEGVSYTTADLQHVLGELFMECRIRAIREDRLGAEMARLQNEIKVRDLEIAELQNQIAADTDVINKIDQANQGLIIQMQQLATERLSNQQAEGGG